jgi:hypothetical protein
VRVICLDVRIFLGDFLEHAPPEVVRVGQNVGLGAER